MAAFTTPALAAGTAALYPWRLSLCVSRGLHAVLQVWAIDSVPERLALAHELGAQPLHLAQDSPLATIRSETEGRGADVVLEVVGSSSALRLAFDALRPCGVLSSVGVHTEASFPFSPVEGYNKNIVYRSGRCPARRYMARLMPVVSACGAPDFTRIITHRMALSAGVEAYDMFANRRWVGSNQRQHAVKIAPACFYGCTHQVSPQLQGKLPIGPDRMDEVASGSTASCLFVLMPQSSVCLAAPLPKGVGRSRGWLLAPGMPDCRDGCIKVVLDPWQ